MAALPTRLSDFYGAPADDVLGSTPAPNPIPDLGDLLTRVLIDIRDWSPTIAPEIAESIGSTRSNVNRATIQLEAEGLVCRWRANKNDPYCLAVTPEGRRVARALEIREAV